MKTVAYHTLGCKLNFSETSGIARNLSADGFQKVAFESVADVYVINTCSVTENADRECRKIVRDALKQNPEGMIVITGCYAQLKPEEIAHIPGVDLVLGASEKFNIGKYLQEIGKKNEAEVHSCEINEIGTFIPSYSAGDRTRSFLKVQDGCDYPCTYCTIPLARGSSRSGSIQEILDQVLILKEKGIKEIVLTGVNIGDFGLQNGIRNSRFLDLIKTLDTVKGIERFRISSIEPNLLSDEIISFVAGSKLFVPHFHIPLQSGSDKILSLMKRRYRKELYANRVATIKRLLPDCSIGVDVIVGFPGETEEDFLETYQFLNELDVSYLHVFTYSERDNTEAISLPGIVPIPERKRRNKMLRILSLKKQQAFYEKHKEEIRAVLFEGAEKDGSMYGFTDNYIKVKRPYDPAWVNTIREVSLLNEELLESEKLN